MITESVLNKWAKCSAKVNVWEALRQKYRKVIYEGLLAGEVIPETGPYTVGISPMGGKELNWELEYEKLLAKNLRREYEYTKEESRVMARERMAKMVKNAPDKAVVRIHGVAYIGGVKLTPKVNAKQEVKATAA